MEVMGLCFSDHNFEDAYDDNFSGNRTLSIVHFCGRYRLIDFALSNLINSGVHYVGIVAHSRYQSLLKYIGRGKSWDLSRKGGDGVTVLTPQTVDEKLPYFGGSGDGMDNVLEYIRSSRKDYVIITASNILYNIDYNDVIEEYEKSRADIIAVYTKKIPDPTARKRSLIYKEEDGRIFGVRGGIPENTEVNLSLNTFVMRTTTLLQLLSAEVPRNMHQFISNVIIPAIPTLKVTGYEYKGYSAHICSSDTFFKHNMEMLSSGNRESLFSNEGRLVFTRTHDSLPTKYGSGAAVSNSIVADGCTIEGSVENCTVFRNVRIMPGAVVKNCILQEGVIVGEDANLEWIILDSGVIITKKRILMGYETHPVYIPQKKII